MQDRWFCFDGYSFETFSTKQEAEAAADSTLDSFRDAAYEGWDDEVENVAWGEIRQVSQPGPRKEHLPGCGEGEHLWCDDDCPVGRSDIDYIVDYSMVDVTDGE